VTSDTVVLLNGRVIGKPKDAADAHEILKALSGQTHEVITGVALHSMDKSHSFSSVTKVHFATLTQAEIAYYIREKSPFDKAGAYGIQEWIGYIGVRGIEGCYYNVMGLPLHSLYCALKQEFGLHTSNLTRV
jgi:septum formation protein